MLKIVFTGGGTLGSVTPLLAVAEKIRENHKDARFLWIGTRLGPECEVVGKADIPCRKIFSGKLRRYFDWRNFIDPFKIVIGFIQSLFLLSKSKSNVIIGAGGFVQVPVTLAGWCLGIPALLHQQDLKPSLSNLILAKFARAITVSFEESAKFFPKQKTVFTGNPARSNMLAGDREIAKKMFNLEEGIPTMLVLGGGTGAARLNRLIWDALPMLSEHSQIIHSVGRKKIQTDRPDHLRYHHYEFLGDELAQAYAAADLVVSRAGMGTLTELAARGIPTILVPISGTHQVDNARYFENKEAAIYFDENKNSKDLAELILSKLNKTDLLERLSKNIHDLYHQDSADKLADLANRLVV